MERSQIWSRMLTIGAIAFAFALILVSASADDVVLLSEDNFEKEVGQDKGALVEFYALWSGHCKKLAPEYEKLSKSFKKAKSVVIGKVDCDEHKSLCSKYGVSGYPTIQWFPKGSLEPKKYEGPRTAEALAEYVNAEGENFMTGRLYRATKLYERHLDDVVAFINEKSGTSQDGNGQLTSKAGIVESFGALVKEFVAAGDAEKKAVFTKIEEEVGKLKGSASRHRKIYLKATKNYLEKGSDYTKNEIQRLQRILDKAGIVESLGALVKEFVAAGDAEKKAMFTKVEEEVGKLKSSASRHGKIYLKATKNYLEKGSDYAKNKIQRLQRILDKWTKYLKQLNNFQDR